MFKYRFPFERVPHGSNVIIYGGGDVGNEFVEQIKRSNHCELVCILDRNHKTTRDDGIKLLPPQAISDFRDDEYDFVVVATVLFASSIDMEVILRGYNVAGDKIILLDYREINNNKMIEISNALCCKIRELTWLTQYISQNNETRFLHGHGYRAYSQNDEDGIIAEIFKRIGTTNKTFVEFGCGNGQENNSHFLLLNGWRGLWIDGGKQNIDNVKKYFAVPLSTKQLIAVNAFISAENINELISENGFNGEIDLLSIDIDGNDYWVWQAITCIKPRVVVIEFNIKFPPPCEWIMKYDPNHVWDGKEKQGASLKSLELLGTKLGYRLVGINKYGVNAFFVKSELAKDLFAEPATAENIYNSALGMFPMWQGHPIGKQFIGNEL